MQTVNRIDGEAEGDSIRGSAFVESKFSRPNFCEKSENHQEVCAYCTHQHTNGYISLDIDRNLYLIADSKTRLSGDQDQ